MENKTLNSPDFDKHDRHPWCYLYFGESKIGDYLDDSSSNFYWIYCNLAQQKSIPSAFIYFIEISLLEKTQLSAIVELYKHYKDAHLYIFAPKELLQSSLYKYALYVKAKALNGLPIEQKVFKTLLKNSLSQSIHDLKQKELLNIMNLWQKKLPFVYYKNNKPLWQSLPAKEFFGEKEAIPDFSDFLDDGVVVLRDSYQKQWKSFSHVACQDNESTICFFPMEEVGNGGQNLHLQHRFETIEWLKDELVFNQEKNRLKILLFHLENDILMLKNMDYLSHHNWLKELISTMQNVMAPYAFFAQWDESHYIICYEDSLVFQDKVIEFFAQFEDYETKEKPIFEVSIFKTENTPLDEIINILDELCNDKITIAKMQEIGITQIHSENDNLTQSEKIFRLLYSSMVSKATLKLQNIYKGLCINTASKVIGEKDGMLFLECQLVQGYAASESKDVTIIGDMFSHDIHASVKLIDLEKNFIIVDEFYYLQSSANNRQFTRVQTRVRTPIAIKQERVGIQGEIIDISLKSLALTTRQSLSDFKLNIGVQYEFRLPDETQEEGYCTIRGLGEITYKNNAKMHENKLVIMLNLKSPYDADLLRYMYMRQKELIGELKALTKTRH